MLGRLSAIHAEGYSTKQESYVVRPPSSAEKIKNTFKPGGGGGGCTSRPPVHGRSLSLSFAQFMPFRSYVVYPNRLSPYTQYYRRSQDLLRTTYVVLKHYTSSLDFNTFNQRYPGPGRVKLVPGHCQLSFWTLETHAQEINDGHQQHSGFILSFVASWRRAKCLFTW